MSDSGPRIVGLAALYRKLDSPAWLESPWRRFMDRWRFAVQGGAVRRMRRGPGGWVDTGVTRQSVASEVDRSAFPLWSRVGSNRMTFRWGEYGTGLLSEDPKSRNRRYFPPYGPGTSLAKWAEKHKMEPRAVAFSIWRRGGLEPRRMLRDSAAAAERRIPGWLNTMAREVEQEASRGSE